jgi:antitoxin VapB
MLRHRLDAEASMTAVVRKASLFRNGRNQAVRIPREFELPGTEVEMHREGDRLVIEPIKRSSLIEYLKNKEPLDEEFPDIDDPLPEPVDL